MTLALLPIRRIMFLFERVRIQEPEVQGVQWPIPCWTLTDSNGGKYCMKHLTISPAGRDALLG